MDKSFGIDLDKVLDDFEKCEDSNHFQPVSIEPGPYWLPSRPTPTEYSTHHTRNYPYHTSSHSSSNYGPLLSESVEKINLADADFSASSTSFSSNVPVQTEPQEKPAFENHLPYSSYVPMQAERLAPFVDHATSTKSIVPNGFDHVEEEDEEVLAVQVMTSHDHLTNFEIKLLPSDQLSSEIFSNDHSSVKSLPVTNESRVESLLGSDSLENDRSEPNVFNNSASVPIDCSFLEAFVDAGLPNEPDISPDDNSVEDSAGNENLASNHSAIQVKEPSVYDVEPDLGFEETEVSESSEEETADIDEKENSTLPLIGFENSPVVGFDISTVGFDKEIDDLDCDDMNSYLSDLQSLDQPNSEKDADNFSTELSIHQELVKANPDSSILLMNDKHVDSNDSSQIEKPSLNSVTSFNTGARPKVRDAAFPKDTNLKPEPPKDESIKDEISSDPETNKPKAIPESRFTSTLVKTVSRVQDDSSDNDASSNKALTFNKQEQNVDDREHSEALEDGILPSQSEVSSANGKKARPNSLNLSSRLSVRPTMADNAQPDSTETSEIQSDCDNVEKLVDFEVPEIATSLPLDQAIPSFEEKPDMIDILELTEDEQLLGKLRPFWIPDVDATNCMHCDLRFTVLKRRHHCRACGKVLCSQCCNSRAKLPYLDYKEARVCSPCLTVLNKVQAVEHLYNPPGPATPMAPSAEEGSVDYLDSVQPDSFQPGIPSTPSPGGMSSSPSPSHSPAQTLPASVQTETSTGWSPNPNNPPEYCSKVPPLQQVSSQRPPPTVLVPVGVLKRGDKIQTGRREPKQVMFSDGIRPGGDLTDLDVAPEPRLPYRRHSRLQRRVDKGSPVAPQLSPQQSHPASPPAASNNRRVKLMRARGRVLIHDEAGPLPPLVPSLDFTLEDKPDPTKLFQRLQEETSAPVVFSLTKNLSISVKIITLDCCMGQEVWCFSSSGMASVGQDEVLFLLQRLPDENAIPRDAFTLFTAIYDNASKGTWFNDLGHLLFPEGLLGAREHAGVLFVRPSHQCQSKLPLPQPPHLVALLIQKWEVPWAKVFPLRLLLRIGAEYRYYPCPLVSVRFRKPVFGEIGHTIMDVLADFRNYQYTLPVVPGVTVVMEDKKTIVNFPRNRYDNVVKLLNSSNEHVLGLGASFSVLADSHLVCMQNEDGSYQTQAINIQNTPHKVTGASFIVFSGALKSASGLSGKSSIVEDGLLVQIMQDSMGALKAALRDMKDYLVSCGQADSPNTQEQVLLRWGPDDKAFNLGVKSPIDGRSLEGVESIRIQAGTDYATDRFLVRWTEVFFLTSETATTGRRLDPMDPCKLAEAVSQACCLALTPRLDSLMESGLTRIGLRVTMDAENVGYEIGSRGMPLEGSHMVDLDSALIPLIMGGGSPEVPLVVELIFHVLHK